ncbi:amidohydrolase family protein [Microbacterium sp. lyk4-40-TSB-66]|uniref:amidohydrolase family protein n=1 Tax=Microbacterium sp. lyk4-40-TSB-66 TaxID=3040294 RepID=UPI002550D2A9|nr:amidohydrolase family protein [Microbacterium sp. lyk4-40-TSB-66]
MTFPVIDAHQHVWDPTRAEYDWLGPESAPIDGVMTFADVAPELRAAGVDFTVQVQSADNAEDTGLMRESAAAHREVAGIVGYAPLHDPAATERTLASWEGDPLLVGVRTLIHNQPDPDWLLRPEVNASLGLLEERDLPFDVVAVLPRHVEIIPLVAERHPRLRMVIDHLAKPPIGVGDGAQWSRLMSAAARSENVFAKVSGLYSAADDSSAWTTEQIRPFLDRALEMFGPARLMYGGDWPISVLSGGYTRVWRGLQPLFDELDPDARERVLGRTAAEFYRLDPRRLALSD